MRISADPNDPGYATFIHHRNAGIRFDGVDTHRVITADDDVGVIVRLVTDEAGRPRVRPDGTGLMKEVLVGKVEIILR